MKEIDNHHVSNKMLGILSTLFVLGLGSSLLAQIQHTVIHSFDGADGFGPMAGVVEGPDGALYGTTRGQSGSENLGTVFRLNRETLELTTLHNFTGTDGSTLYSGLAIGNDGLLYGTTFDGGGSEFGTLFRVGIDGLGFLSLHSFAGADGANPADLALFQGIDEKFYGATSEGGPNNGGTLFQFDEATRELVTIHAFMASGGGGVDAGLVPGRDGSWYGTTYRGGAFGAGSVFRVNPTTFVLTTLHDFGGGGGQNPVPGALMQSTDGMLYGTTQLGGFGTVYKLDPETLDFTNLHTFTGIANGRTPLGGVTEGPDGFLYGTTVLGGQGYGTIYRVNPATLAYNIVVPFGGSNGRSPSGNLYRASDGALYGVTRLGGDFNSGTVFRLSFAVPCAIDADCAGVDTSLCTCNHCAAGFCTSMPVEFGNVNCSANQAPDLDDILCVLSGFTAFDHCPNADIASTTTPGACQGDGMINLDDILAVIGAFSGTSPCACNP